MTGFVHRCIAVLLLMNVCASGMAVNNSIIFRQNLKNTAMSSRAPDAKLVDLQHQIDQLEKKLSQTNGQQTALHQQLSQTKQRLEQAVAVLHNTRLQLAQQQHLYRKFNQEQMTHQHQLQTHQTLLAQQLRAIYQLASPSPLTIVLATDNPNTNERLLNYCRYLQQAHLSHIQKIKQSLQQITQNTQQIDQKTQLLQHLQHEEQKNHLALETSRLQHQQALQSLSVEIQQQHLQLQQLITNKQHLQSVITHLQHPAHISLLNFLKHPDFASQQGKLRWPVQGTIIEHFGAPIAASELKWTDVLIKAPQGQSVHAVASGKVVFANAMAGYGLLLIIDHGNGYMTLYGHNHSIYKKVGDTIKTGELIATVGQSEDYSIAGLYFGIRHDGKPLNPEHWCG